MEDGDKLSEISRKGKAMKVDGQDYEKNHVDELVGTIRTSDNVFRPQHYKKWAMEPFTYIMLNGLPFAEGCIVKYVMRWRDKNGIEDLRKAQRIIEMIIEMEEHREKYTPEKGCL